MNNRSRSPFETAYAGLLRANGFLLHTCEEERLTLHPKEMPMYIARFSYSVLPINRERAIEFIQREVEAAQHKQLHARLLIPLTRGVGGAALQFEVELPSLDEFERFRERGIESGTETGDWMHAFSEILTAPPEVELLRVAGTAKQR
jgi:hypothetical protein